MSDDIGSPAPGSVEATAHRFGMSRATVRHRMAGAADVQVVLAGATLARDPYRVNEALNG